MADCGFIALYRGLRESFQSLFTSQDFGSGFELLSTEFSLQSLRVHLWGDLIGLNIIDPDDVTQSLLGRQVAIPTIFRTLNSISFLLIEIKEIQQKYQPKNASEVILFSKDEVRTLHSSKSVCNISTTNLIPFRQRIRSNERQKSLDSIARWMLRYARKLDEKVKRLKGLIDGLEDVSRIAGISPQPQAQAPNRLITQQDESPPPYSALPLAAPCRPRVAAPAHTTRSTLVPSSRFSTNLLGNHHTAIKTYVAASSKERSHPVPAAREKLIRLSEQQFKDLRIDVYDEMLRRQKCERPTSAPTLLWLPHISSYHPKRNELAGNSHH